MEVSAFQRLERHLQEQLLAHLHLLLPSDSILATLQRLCHPGEPLILGAPLQVFAPVHPLCLMHVICSALRVPPVMWTACLAVWAMSGTRDACCAGAHLQRAAWVGLEKCMLRPAEVPGAADAAYSAMVSLMPLLPLPPSAFPGGRLHVKLRCPATSLAAPRLKQSTARMPLSDKEWRAGEQLLMVQSDPKAMHNAEAGGSWSASSSCSNANQEDQSVWAAALRCLQKAPPEKASCRCSSRCFKQGLVHIRPHSSQMCCELLAGCGVPCQQHRRLLCQDNIRHSLPDFLWRPPPYSANNLQVGPHHTTLPYQPSKSSQSQKVAVHLSNWQSIGQKARECFSYAGCSA